MYFSVFLDVFGGTYVPPNNDVKSLVKAQYFPIKDKSVIKYCTFYTHM